MRTTEEMDELNKAINAAVPGIRIAGEQTVAGWLFRLEVACFDFVRTGETAGGWRRLMAVHEQAGEFIAAQLDAVTAELQAAQEATQAQADIVARLRAELDHANEEQVGLMAERDRLANEVEELERLRAWDENSATLPGGVVMEFTRLDNAWRALVRQKDEARALSRQYYQEAQALRAEAVRLRAHGRRSVVIACPADCPGLHMDNCNAQMTCPDSPPATALPPQASFPPEQT